MYRGNDKCAVYYVYCCMDYFYITVNVLKYYVSVYKWSECVKCTLIFCFMYFSIKFHLVELYRVPCGCTEEGSSSRGRRYLNMYTYIHICIDPFRMGSVRQRKFANSRNLSVMFNIKFFCWKKVSSKFKWITFFLIFLLSKQIHGVS